MTDLNSSTQKRKKYHCAKCGEPFHFQLKRSWFVKRVLYFLPVRKYFCAKCKKASYIFVDKSHA